MLKTVDILVIVFTLSTFTLILGSKFYAPLQNIFTEILAIDTLALFGDRVTLDLRGHCHLGDVRGSCVDIITTILKGEFTGYESQEVEEGVEALAERVIGFQKVLFVSHQLCEFESP